MQPYSVVHVADWNGRWKESVPAGVEAREKQLEIVNEFWEDGSLKLRTVLEYGPPSGGSQAERVVTVTPAYDADGNLVSVIHDAPGVEEDIEVDLTWVGSGGLFRPSTHQTWAFDATTGATALVEEGRFSYDDLGWGAGLTDGKLTHQEVCSGLVGALCGEQLAWDFTWHDRGALWTMNGPAGDAKTVSAVTFGDVLPATVLDALGWTSTSTYDGFGQPLTAVDPNGVTTRKVYDALGRVVEEHRAGAGGVEKKVTSVAYHDDTVPNYVATTRYAYEDDGDDSSVVVEYTVLDGLGRPVQTWAPDEYGLGWVVTESVQDLAGNPSYSGHPHRETTFLADLAGTQSDKVAHRAYVDAFGLVWEEWEDEWSNVGKVTRTVPEPGVVRTTDADDRIHEVRTDTHGRVVQVREGRAASMVTTGTYRYDGRGRVVRFIDGNGNTYRYDYDGAGRHHQVWRAGPGAAFQRYYAFTYDGPYPQTMREGGPNGLLVVEWDYDALGRTTEKRVLTDAADPFGTWDTYTWTWDTEWVGARSSVTDPWGAVTYTYDPHFTFGGFGLPTRVERTFTDLATPVAVDRTYDFAGREATVSWPGGAVSAATYGPAGHLLTQDVVWAGGTADVSYLYDAEYGTPSGWFGGQEGAGNETFVVTQDRYGPTRLASIQWARSSGAILRQVTYQWSMSGLLNQKEVSPMLEAFFYGYDDLKRITSVTDNGRQIERWAYDAIGNPTWNSDWWAGNATYGAAPRFHEIGNRTKAGGVVESHIWDPTNGRLLARARTVNGAFRESDTYTYDGSGRLAVSVEAGTAPGAGVSTLFSTYAYDVDDNLVREDRQEPHGPSAMLYRFEGWREDTVTGLTIESVLPMMSLVDGVPRWTFAEPDGRTLETYTSTGAAVTFEIVGVYGEALPDFRGVNQLYQQATTWDVGGLHGLEPDRASGLVHAGARHFLMRDGIWLQPEPLLHLGMQQGVLTIPRGFGGIYAAGNTNSYMDASGYSLFGGNKTADEEDLNLNGRYQQGDKVGVPDAIAAAAPAVTALHNSAENTEGFQFLQDDGGGGLQSVGPAVATQGGSRYDAETDRNDEVHSMDDATDAAGLTVMGEGGPPLVAAVHSHSYQARHLTPHDDAASAGFAREHGAGAVVAASNRKFGSAQRLEVSLTQETSPGAFTVTHLNGDTASDVLTVKSTRSIP